MNLHYLFVFLFLYVFAFIFNSFPQTRTVFILKSYLQWSFRTVVSYLWIERQEGLWLWRKCKIQYNLIAVFFLKNVYWKIVHVIFFGINFSTDNRLADYFFSILRDSYLVECKIKFKSTNDGLIYRVISLKLNVRIWFHIL